LTKKIITLLRWEFEDKYRFPLLELIVIILVILIIGHGKISVSGIDPISIEIHVAMYASRILDAYFPLGVLLLGVFLSNSIAGSLEQGEAKVLLSYPLSRFEVITVKIGLHFLIFFMMYTIISVWAVAILAPQVLFTLVYSIIIAGIALYLLFFSSLFTLISVTINNVKSSIIMTIFVTLTAFSVSPLFLRAVGFFSTLTVSYGELVWPNFSFSSNIQVPFPPVLIVHIMITIIALVAAITYFCRFLEVP